MKVDASMYGNRNLNLTMRVRQNITLSTIANNPRHLPTEIKNASTADSMQAVASAEINIVSI